MATGDTPVVLLDGGLGTTLTEPPYNQRFDQSTPLWSSHLLYEGSDVLCAAQSEFVRAGADILLTATYQASFEGFRSTLRNQMHAGDVRKHNSTLMTRESTEYMRSAVLIAKKALEARSARRNEVAVPFALPAVALALGPLGATLVPSQEYTGHYPLDKSSQQALKEWHTERIKVFSDHQESWDNVEFIACETLKRIDEIKAVREVMTEVFATPNIAASATIQSKTSMAKRKKWWISTVWPNEIKDEEIRAAVEAMLQNGTVGTASSVNDVSTCTDHALTTPWAIGVNCTGIDKVQVLVQRMEVHVTALAESGRWRSEWEPDSDDPARLKEAVSPARMRPWLVLYPDGAKGLRYDSEKMEWVQSEASVDDGVEWHDALWNIVAEIRQRGNWEGIVVGGCCKTSPQQILRLRQHIDE